MTAPNHIAYEDVGEAIQKVTAYIQQLKRENPEAAGADIGEHLNPGDVYDAYLEIGREPVLDDILEQERCGPFAAVFLQRFPNEDPSGWQQYTAKTYHPEYALGFKSGFRLIVPADDAGLGIVYLRGVYDGVMANAAMF